ncbi:TIGR03089 family protein [Nocardioides yefusunii]|uniref:TIGR03089 family protein n=1 Tax=Nocardioides yefusunii TaxID=2500546 RepID=A0ABW1R1H5_9ACTN|nr:TIGR03089 family protein [Nocardioides yefusunii]
MSASAPTTFSAALSSVMRLSPGEPLVTFYDHSTFERVELSVITYANWVSKAAGLLADEHDLERGARIRLDLPTHWLGTVFLGAAWTVGLDVVLDDSVADSELDAVVCGPDSLERWAEIADDVPVLACSLLPLGVRFREPLPAGVHDVGVEVWGQPDAFTAWDAPTGADAAVTTAAGTLTQAQTWETAASGSLLTDRGRLLTTLNPTSPSGVNVFTEPLVRAGSVVLVARPDADRLDAVAAQERTTSVLVNPS